MKNEIVVIGGGESGVGAAFLAKKNGINVFLSERNIIENKFKKVLKENNIGYEEGGHTLSKFLNANEIIKSPGIPENIELLNKVKSKKIPIISEIEFAFRFTDSNIISVTGSNGKTTTCSLIFHILKSSGLNVGLGGNIGNSFSFLIAENKYDYIVLELSSFQLDNISRFKSFISVLTNLSPDHLERYNYAFKNYINSKFNIVSNHTKNDFFIYNEDDQTINYELENRQIISKKFHSQKIL